MLMDLVTGYEHMGIPTPDMKKTEEFYTGLGFSIDHETTNNGYPVKFFKYGDIVIETYETGDPLPMKPGAVEHIAFTTKDIVATVAEMKRLGYEISDGPTWLPFYAHGVGFAKITGPSAEIVEFLQPFKSDEERDKAIEALGLSK